MMFFFLCALCLYVSHRPFRSSLAAREYTIIFINIVGSIALSEIWETKTLCAQCTTYNSAYIIKGNKLKGKIYRAEYRISINKANATIFRMFEKGKKKKNSRLNKSSFIERNHFFLVYMKSNTSSAIGMCRKPYSLQSSVCQCIKSDHWCFCCNGPKVKKNQPKSMSFSTVMWHWNFMIWNSVWDGCLFFEKGGWAKYVYISFLIRLR